MARTGRRPGASGTREAILDAARRAFGERGYDRTSIRGVARDAAVDPALVHHYFGTKAGLFAAAMELPADPIALLGGVMEGGPREELGERLARAVLTMWDTADLIPVAALLRSGLTNDAAADMLRQFVGDAIVGTVAAGLEGDDARLRAELAASQLLGIAVARYIVGVEPMASIDVEELVRRVAPVLQLHLDGPDG